ncbi:MAG: putative peptidyl-prolyl cis-trans isomerase Cbf2 [Candidatus Dichloromethanomonas elyunquensis]|nr:MAG: putative peptidyl-prolyl cis-trans isomerase Cbf2 [Candidatus Dichloromethanomonas elyunquensis]
MKKITSLILIFILLAVFNGCAKKEDFAVKVNDKAVSMTTYNQKLNAIKTYLQKQGIDFNSDQGKTTLESVKSDLLENLISNELISQQVSKSKWDLNDPEIAKQVEDLKNQIPDGDYQKWLDQQATTNEEVVNYFAFTVNVEKDVTVTDQDVKQYFDSNYSKYGGQEEQVKARHILVATEQEALDIIAQLKAGKDFATLAKEKSTDTGSKDSGGDLGYFSRGQMVPAFEEAAFSQKIGQVSDKPVKTDYGYHVIFVEDHKQAVKPDFAKVKASVQKDALDYAKNQKSQSYFSKLRQDAKIEYAESLKPKAS